MSKGTPYLPTSLFPLFITLALVFVGFFASSVIAQEPSLISEYQSACERIESTLESKAYQNAPEERQKKLLHESLFDDIQREEVAVTFRSITAADPSERYQILKEGIQEETGEDWQCSGLARVMGQ